MKNKFKSFLKSTPFILTASLVLPVGFSLFVYFIDPKTSFNNDSFDGYHMPELEEEFQLNSTTRLFKVANYSSQNNYQGGAFYKNYYFIAANDLENILIYDMDSYELEAVVRETDENTLYHCNTIAFGNTFYSPKDRFPLLYISMENAKVHATMVYRVHRQGNYYVTTKVQQINFPSTAQCGISFPNSYIDQKEQKLYYAGYTGGTYKKQEGNNLKFFRFPLPKAPTEDNKGVDLSTVNLKTEEAEDSFELPAETATQGGFVANNHLYQVYGFEKDPLLIVTDLKNHQVTYKISIGSVGNYDEYENIAVYNERLFAFGIRSLSIYSFDYSYSNL